MSKSKSSLFLDTNITMYAAGDDHPYKESCTWVVSEIAGGRLDAVIDTETIQEILYRYFAIRRNDIGVRMARGLLNLVPTIFPVDMGDVNLAIDLLEKYAHLGLQPRDAVHMAVMLRNGIEQIISTDRHFDKLPGIKRIDPRDMYSAR